MGQRFVACDREQSFLMPPDVPEWLSEDHLAWFVIGAVGEMNLEGFYAAYRQDGGRRRSRRRRPPQTYATALRQMQQQSAWMVECTSSRIATLVG